MSEFMKRFKQLRTTKGITQAQLADELNVTQTAITYWENGKREPNIDMLKKIAEYFNVSLDYLIAGTSYVPSQAVKTISTILEEPNTVAAHFDGEQFTDEEIAKIKEYIDFVKSKRK